MDSATRVLLLTVLGMAALPNCAPDFDALSAGIESTAGTTSAGTASAGDGSSAGGSDPQGGSSGEGSLGGAFPGGAGGDAGAGEAGAESGLGGEGGTGPKCGSWPSGATIYNGFDEGLEGAGFSSVSSRGSVDTTKGATASSAWDSKEGASCPGALRFSFSFKGYASGSDADEVGYGTYEFAPASWTSGTSLHVTVKVSQANAPINGVRLFVVSGDKYLYDSVFDNTAFRSAGWNEMVLPTVASDWYDPNGVHQLGVEVRLARADTPDIPAQPPQVLKVWLDDIWLEPK